MLKPIDSYTNYPKIHCPFTRRYFRMTDEEFHAAKESGRSCRHPDILLVTPARDPDYDWVFDDNDTIAVEKLDGTNLGVHMDPVEGTLDLIMNRKNPIYPWTVLWEGDRLRCAYMQGILNAGMRGWFDSKEATDDCGWSYGELVGPLLQGNPLALREHIWVPFSKARKSFRYNSWHKYEHTFDNIDIWFEDYLKSRMAGRPSSLFMDGIENCIPFAEGLVFTNSTRMAEGKVGLAKLRRNMFPWYWADISPTIMKEWEEFRSKWEENDLSIPDLIKYPTTATRAASNKRRS